MRGTYPQAKTEEFMNMKDLPEEHGSELDLSEDGGSSIASSAELNFDTFDYQMGFDQDMHNHYQWMGFEDDFSSAFNRTIATHETVAESSEISEEHLTSLDLSTQQFDIANGGIHANIGQGLQSGSGLQNGQELSNGGIINNNIQNSSLYPIFNNPGVLHGSGFNPVYSEPLNNQVREQSVERTEDISDKDSYGTNGVAQKLLHTLRFGAPMELKTLTLPSHSDILEALNYNDIPPLEYSIDLIDFPYKSRVETQIKCKLHIRNSVTGKPPSRVLLHLPIDTVARPRFHLMDSENFKANENFRSKTFWLSADVINPRMPNERILMCSKCLERERRRAFRKKAMDPHEETYWTGIQDRRIVIFNCREVISMSEDGNIELPLRIACYGRHHAAKSGFQLVVALRDSDNNLLGRVVSGKIFITDNHKDHRKQNVANNLTNDNIDNNTSNTSSLASPASNYVLSRPTTPSSVDSFDSKSIDSQPEIDASSTNSSRRHVQRASSVSNSLGISHSVHPYARPNVVNLPSAQLARQIQQSQSVPSWIADINPSLDSVNRSPISHPQYQQQARLASNCYTNNSIRRGSVQSPVDTSSTASSASALNDSFQSNKSPTIFRVIPPTGSVRGGCEVTLLGQNFRPGLVAMFGHTASISTQCWSESTIIAHLPPSNQPGPVSVTFKLEGEEFYSGPPAVFTYVNDGEEKLKELALQMIGYKLTGNFEDANMVADRISETNSQANDTTSINTINNKNNGRRENLDSETTRMPVLPESAEQLALWVLNNLHKIEPSRPSNVNLRNNEGQSMVHIASLLGYASVIKALMAWNAYLDSQDVNGYTPLHFAVLFGNRNTTRLLLSADADPFNRTLNGLTALDLADVTVEDLLPKDQRSWYYELNHRGSSSSLNSMVINWKEHIVSGQEVGEAVYGSSAMITPDASEHNSENMAINSDNDKEIGNGDLEKTLGPEVSTHREGIYHSGASITEQNIVYSPEGSRSTLDELDLEYNRNVRKPPSYSQLFPNESEEHIILGTHSESSVRLRENLKLNGSKSDHVHGCDELFGNKESSLKVDALENNCNSNTRSFNQSKPAWTEKWASRNMEIRNDKMLFTFWIPLSFVTILGIFAIYVLQNYDSRDSHPLASKIGDFVGVVFSKVLDRMMPLPRSIQQGNHPTWLE